MTAARLSCDMSMPTGCQCQSFRLQGELDILATGSWQAVDRAEPFGGYLVVIGSSQGYRVKRRRYVALRQDQRALIFDIDGYCFGVASSVRILEPDFPVDLGLALASLRLLEDIESAGLVLQVVVADVGDDQVGFAVKRKRCEVFPVLVVRLLELGPAETGAGQVNRVQDFLGATVVDNPEDAGLALRPREPAGFTDLGVFEAPRDFECQRCRLLRIGAAGKQHE